jgi:hypothetical protein
MQKLIVDKLILGTIENAAIRKNLTTRLETSRKLMKRAVIRNYSACMKRQGK